MRPFRELLPWCRPATPPAGSSATLETSSLAGPTRGSSGNQQLQDLSGLGSGTPARFAQVAANEPVADTPPQPDKPNSHDISSRRWIAEQNLRARLVDEAHAASNVATLRALLGLDGAEPTARTPDDEIGSFKQLSEELKAMVESGTVRDLQHESPLTVIKAVISRIETSPEVFHLNRSAAMDTVLEALVHAPLHDRADGMTALSALTTMTPTHAERLYDAIFKPLHEAYVNSKADQLRREPKPFPIYDQQYKDALTNRARWLVELNPKRHLEEAIAILEDAASLAPTLRAEPLKALASHLHTLDGNARAQIFDAIWRTLEWNSAPVAGKPGAGAIVLPPLAAAVSDLPDSDHRQQAFSRLLIAGCNLRSERGAETVVNLLPAAGTFSGEGRSLSVYIILDSLAAMSDQTSFIEQALVTDRSHALPETEFKRVFYNVLERLESESNSRDYGREDTRSKELRRLIEALGCLSDENERADQFPRFSAQIVRTSSRHRDALFEALREQLDTLSAEARENAARWLAPLSRTTDEQTRY